MNRLFLMKCDIVDNFISIWFSFILFISCKAVRYGIGKINSGFKEFKYYFENF